MNTTSNNSESGAAHTPTPGEDGGAIPRDSAGSPAGSPSLVYRCQSKTYIPWSRQQKRVFSRLKSFFIEVDSRGCQTFRVDLTTATGGNAKLLSRHHRELRRRVQREFGYYVEYFQVQTREGHGVLHCVWAIKSEKAAFIPQKWLADTWDEIHGARIVWIQRVTTKAHQKNVTRYISTQYLAGQNALVRMSYSWHRCKVALGRGWSTLKRLCTERRPVLYHERFYGKEVPIYAQLPMRDIVRAWESLITVGWALLDGAFYRVEGKTVKIKGMVAESFAISENDLKEMFILNGGVK